MKPVEFKKAKPEDAPMIWEILQQAILRRKSDGSSQWQDGYPNFSTVESDLQKGVGYVLTEGDKIIGYAALWANDEPPYKQIKGQWLIGGDFLVVHRVAISDKVLGRGFAQEIFLRIEAIALKMNLPSIRVDTNEDNFPMLHILQKLNYTYCGEIKMRGTPRKAFEKLVSTRGTP